MINMEERGWCHHADRGRRKVNARDSEQRDTSARKKHGGVRATREVFRDVEKLSRRHYMYLTLDGMAQEACEACECHGPAGIVITKLSDSRPWRPPLPKSSRGSSGCPVRVLRGRLPCLQVPW